MGWNGAAYKKDHFFDLLNGVHSDKFNDASLDDKFKESYRYFRKLAGEDPEDGDVRFANYLRSSRKEFIERIAGPMQTDSWKTYMLPTQIERAQEKCEIIIRDVPKDLGFEDRQNEYCDKCGHFMDRLYQEAESDQDRYLFLWAAIYLKTCYENDCIIYGGY